MRSFNFLKTVAALFLVMTGVACVPFEQVPNADRGALAIEVSAEQRPNCTVLAEVHGTAISSDIAEATRGATNDMRNAALRVNANYVFIDTNGSQPRGSLVEVAMSGHALLCPIAK